MSNIFENKGAMAATIVIAASDSLCVGAANYVCDGVSDQVEIQTAIDIVAALGGGRVILSEGTFYLASAAQITLGAKVELVGQGIEKTIIRRTGGATTQNILVNVANAAIRYLTVDANKTVAGGDVGIGIGGAAIEFEFESVMVRDAEHEAYGFDFGCNNGTISNCFAKNSREGFRITDGSHDLAFVNCIAIGPFTQGGISIFQHTGVVTTTERIAFTNCMVINPTANYSILVSGEVAGLSQIRDISFINCYVYEPTQAIPSVQMIAYYDRITIIGGKYEQIIWIHSVNAAHVKILGAEIISGGAAANYGIYVDGGNDHIFANNHIVSINNSIRADAGSRLKILGNVCEIPSGTTTINIYTGNDIQILDNTCRRTDTGGLGQIRLQSPVTRAQVKNNYSTVWNQAVGTDYARKLNDLFMDILAASTNYVRDDEDLSIATPITFTITNQPDVPRTINWVITHANITAFTLVITGVNAKGDTISETFTQAIGWSGETSNAFATITSIQMTARTGTGAGDLGDVGIGSKLGLANKIYAAGDVFKVKKNNAHYPAASYTVSAAPGTVDVSIGGAIVGGDDFTIYYIHNLNVVA